MGCVGSSQIAKPTDQERRRRLSIGDIEDAKGNQKVNDVAEAEARGFLKSYKDKALLDLINGQDENDCGPRRKFSLGSETDQDLNKRASFSAKTVVQEGDAKNSANHIGFACRKGLKPESPNQDSWTVLMIEGDFSVYGVFDGHGVKGHDVSNFVRINFPKLLVKSDDFRDNPASALIEAYAKIQALIEVQTKNGSMNATMSGTTSSVILHRHADNKLFIAHCGDSRCVLAREGVQAVAEPLTKDHKPDDPEERKRIENSGGRVVHDGFTNFRVYARAGAYPGLNMSRALGDLMGYYNAGISATPTVAEVDLLPEDTILILCSDGVWEFITDQEAVKIVYPLCFGTTQDPVKAAEVLAKTAWDRWMHEESGMVVDDITCILVTLQNPTAPS